MLLWVIKSLAAPRVYTCKTHSGKPPAMLHSKGNYALQRTVLYTMYQGTGNGTVQVLSFMFGYLAILINKEMLFLNVMESRKQYIGFKKEQTPSFPVNCCICCRPQLLYCIPHWQKTYYFLPCLPFLGSQQQSYSTRCRNPREYEIKY